MTLEFRDSTDQPLQRWYLDVVSGTKDHSAWAAQLHLDNIKRHPEVKALIERKPKWEHRFDCAPTNICGENYHAILVKDVKKYLHVMQMSVCPYVERHGKCISDTRFSRVSFSHSFVNF